MIETYDNVGAVVKVQDLIDAIGNEDFDKELFTALKRYIKAIGYKKRLDEDQEKLTICLKFGTEQEAKKFLTEINRAAKLTDF